jgi:UDP-2,3-diacylglucosamine pyrophosphatase LpxH
VVEHISADQRIWFISDLHIGDGTPCDVFFGKDRQLISLCNRVNEEGAVLVIVGDAIDFHQAWSFTRVLRAHQELFHALSSIAREGRLYYVIGNHDFEINLFKEILSFRVCDELMIGDRIRCIHGWQYDPYLSKTIGHGHEWSTTIHHLVERYLGTWLRIPLGEFYTLGNRVMFWGAHKLAVLASGWARVTRLAGNQSTSTAVADYLDYWARGNLGDPMGMFRPMWEELSTGRWDAIVCGHSHLPGLVPCADATYVNTGSWTFASSHYVIWDGQDWSCQDWLTGKHFTSDFYDLLVDGTIYEKDFWQWWRENYMGMLRFREGEERKGRLRGWESYVRDHQHLSQLRPVMRSPLPKTISADAVPAEADVDPADTMNNG